jgi:precorrin-6A synthase
MLDGVQAFRGVPPENVDIYWGANLGTDSESAIAGPLGEKADAISQARATARDKAGWVMDTYLLRKRLPDSD